MPADAKRNVVDIIIRGEVEWNAKEIEEERQVATGPRGQIRSDSNDDDDEPHNSIRRQSFHWTPGGKGGREDACRGGEGQQGVPRTRITTRAALVKHNIMLRLGSTLSHCKQTAFHKRGRLRTDGHNIATTVQWRYISIVKIGRSRRLY